MKFMKYECDNCGVIMDSPGLPNECTGCGVTGHFIKISQYEVNNNVLLIDQLDILNLQLKKITKALECIAENGRK